MPARSETLAGLAPHLTALPRPIIAHFWAKPQGGVPLLRFLACRSLSDLLPDLHALVPVLAALGGQEAIAGTFHAIQGIGRWWP